jgi:hypothetical protein
LPTPILEASFCRIVLHIGIPTFFRRIVGQTRLRTDERMRTFKSPGGASMVIMFDLRSHS